MELASVHSKSLVEMLLQVNALSNMARGAGYGTSEARSYLSTAATWMSKIDAEMESLKRELEDYSTLT